MELEQTIDNGNGEVMHATIGKIEPVDVIEGDIEELAAGMDRALERRLELHEQAEGIITETEEIDVALRDARAKVDRLRQALALAREAAELTPNLPPELKPAGGDSEAPPTLEEPPASTPSRNGDIPDAGNGSQRCRSSLIPADELPPVGGPVDEDLAKAATPASSEEPTEEDEEPETETPAPPPVATAGKHEDQVLEVLRAASGPVSNSDVVEATDLSAETVRRSLKALVAEGKASVSGKARWTRYELIESKTPVTPPAERKARPSSEDTPASQSRAADKQEPTDEGKVLSALQLGRQDIGALSIAVGITIPKLRTILGKLIREGDVRLQKGDPPEYYLAP